MYTPSYGAALMGLCCSNKYVTDYSAYLVWVVSKNRYGKHGRRKAN